jgi:protoheme IX farnesyltransferase
MTTLTPAAGLSAREMALDPASNSAASLFTARARDYLQLTKPRIAVMVLVTVSVGYALGCEGRYDGRLLTESLCGVGLVAAACSVLNQWLERGTDRRMVRTAERPVAAGRVSPVEALTLGLILAVAGTAWLVWRVNLLTAGLTLVTLVAYVCLYTPLKLRTSLCTTIGAIPGALPPVIGWTAAGQELNIAALSLFAVLFLWQFPHFFAIAWIYQNDYRMAGLKMLPGNGRSRVVGSLAVAYAVALIPVSLLPRTVGLAGSGYALAAICLGTGYLLASVVFAIREDRLAARRLLWISLIYLPLLLFALTIDHWRLIQ